MNHVKSIIIIFPIFILLNCSKPTEKSVVTIIGNPNQASYEVDFDVIKIFEIENDIKVKYIRGPESSSERIKYYINKLEKGDQDIDVYFIDIIWPAIFGKYMLDLKQFLNEESKMHFKTIVNNNTVDGKLIGMPFYTDAGILYYRKDLLIKYNIKEPPKSWDEFEVVSKFIQNAERNKGNKKFWAFVWQGAPYEGLTCNALEWQYSHGGGDIIDSKGVITVNNIKTIKALKRAKSWIGTITPQGVIGFQEEDSRSIWQSGNVLFMRNWPYAFALGEKAESPVKDKFDVTIMPAERDKYSACLGGWQLAVNKKSKNIKNAIKLVKFLTSPKIQKIRALEGSFLPTIPTLYDDKDILNKYSFFKNLKNVFVKGAVARPSTVSGSQYDKISNAYFISVHKILTGKSRPEKELALLEKKLKKILKKKK